MPQFYFHLCAPQARQVDPEGLSLPDAEAAFYQGFRRARELAADDGCCRQGQVEVADEAGAAVWTIPLVEILDVTG